jgi:hypothetical protein
MADEPENMTSGGRRGETGILTQVFPEAQTAGPGHRQDRRTQTAKRCLQHHTHQSTPAPAFLLTGQLGDGATMIACAELMQESSPPKQRNLTRPSNFERATPNQI